MFYEQLKKACYVRGTTPTAITKELEITSANTGKWKNGGNPTVENLIKIAKLLEVTTDYLLGLDDTIATPLSANKNPADEERQGTVQGGDVTNIFEKRFEGMDMSFFEHPPREVFKALRLEQNLSCDEFSEVLTKFTKEKSKRTGFQSDARTVSTDSYARFETNDYGYPDDLHEQIYPAQPKHSSKGGSYAIGEYGLNYLDALAIKAYYEKLLNIDIFKGDAIAINKSLSSNPVVLRTRGLIDSGRLTVEKIAAATDISVLSIQSLVKGERLLLPSAMERLDTYLGAFVSNTEPFALTEELDVLETKLSNLAEISESMPEPDDPNHGDAQ